MAVDIRAKVTCSAGELISGSTSDSYRAESGVIYQRGSCVVKGINALAVGTPVTFSYQGPQRGGQIKRRLLVLGSSCNPFEGTTNYELGCEFTLYKDYSETKVFTWRGVGDPSMDEEDAKVVTVPLLADQIATAILSKLSLSGTCNLTNKFSDAEFDLSSGYVNVLSELLQSECKLAYITPDGTVSVVPALGTGTGTSFGVNSLIELQPLSIGPPPTAKTIVNYSTRKLKKPDPDKADELNWELQESYGEQTTVTVDIPQYVTLTLPGLGSFSPTNRTIKYTYTPYTKVETAYDTLDRVTTRITTERTILAAIAPGYVQANGITLYAVGTGSFTVEALPPPEGSIAFTIVTTETTKYKVPAPATFPTPPDYSPDYPEGYEEIVSVETTVSEPLVKLIGSTNIYRYAGEQNVGFTYGLSDDMRFTASKEIRTQETSKGAQGQQVVKSFTERFSCRAYAISGQQGLVESIDRLAENDELFGEGGRAIGLILDARSLEKTGVETQIVTGREVGLQQRPPQGERTNAEVEVVNASADISADSGVGTSSFQLPYAPDDIFVKSGATYSAISSDAKEKAAAYGRVQLKLRSGARYGVNVKAAASAYSGDVAGTVGVSAGGVSVFGLAEGVSYTMDSSGIVVSMDVLPLGTSGGAAGGSGGSFTTASWVPLPTGVTTLPAAPTVTDPTPTQWLGYVATVGANPQTTLNAAFPSAVSGDGVQDTSTWKVWKYNGSVWVDLGTDVVPTVTPSVLVPFANERVAADAVTRTGIEVQSLPYAIGLLTEVTFTTNTKSVGRAILPVSIPAAVSITLLPRPLRVATGASAKPPVAAIGLTALAPTAAAGKTVAPAVVELTLAANAPAYVGKEATVVQPPATTLSVAGVAPTINTPIAPPVATIGLTPFLPLIWREPIEFVGAGTIGSSTASFGSLPWPTHKANDIGLWVIETEGGSTDITPPTGWAAVPGSPVQDTGASGGSKLHLWWKRATNNAEPTVTVPDSGDHQVARIFAFRGCVSVGDPWDATTTGSKVVASTTATVPAVTTTTFNAQVVMIIGRPNDTASTTEFSNPVNSGLVGLVEHGEAGTTQGFGGGFVVLSGRKELPGSTGTTTVTKASSTTDTYIVLALKS